MPSVAIGNRNQIPELRTLLTSVAFLAADETPPAKAASLTAVPLVRTSPGPALAPEGAKFMRTTIREYRLRVRLAALYRSGFIESSPRTTPRVSPTFMIEAIAGGTKSAVA